MSKWADTRVSQYSKGMLQRIGIAQALLHEPDVVLLDEPTDGVDPLGRKQIREILVELKEANEDGAANPPLLRQETDPVDGLGRKDAAAVGSRRRFRQVIELAESAGDAIKQALARARLADVHIRAGELDRAREELTLSVRLDPTNPKVYFKISRVLQLLGDTVGAEKALGMHADILARSRVEERIPEP